LSTVAPRAVLVSRPSELTALVARHGTREQARFFLESRGRTLAEVEARHHRQDQALAVVRGSIPLRWRRAEVDRGDLSRFVFGPEDVVVAVGQDGLVANVAKYLTGQPVIGVNDDPARHEGVLVPHPAGAAGSLLLAAAAGSCTIEERRMVAAALDDGQTLLALNEVFLGHRTHQSARYRIGTGGKEEAHSSSGIIVATGTGATGWARSIVRQRRAAPPLPGPGEPRLAFFVREAFPTVATGVELDGGVLEEGQALEVVSEMNEGGTVFGDGIEEDRLELSWGMRVRVALARQRLRLVKG
jgi:hypothetical protein